MMSNRDVFILLIGAAGPSCLIAWAASFWIRRRAPEWGLMDRPGDRKAHSAPTPLGGGLAIWLAVVASFAIGQAVLWLAARDAGGGGFIQALIPDFARPHLSGLREQSGALWVLLSAGTILMAVGLLDDVCGVDWRVRLAIQFVVAAACVAWQGWRLTAFIPWPQVTWPLSALWMVVLINAFNMLDNMDGASAGVAAIAAGLLAAAVLWPDPRTSGPQWFVGGFLLVLVGALAGFLWHNHPPARLFMGDAGSYFIGFCIAAATLLATFAGYEGERRHAVLAPLCVMAVPLYDMATVLWIRLRQGRSLFQADTSHFSHRLVELGMSKRQAVLTLYLTTAATGLGALLLRQVDAAGAGIVLLMIFSVLLLIGLLETAARWKLER